MKHTQALALIAAENAIAIAHHLEDAEQPQRRFAIAQFAVVLAKMEEEGAIKPQDREDLCVQIAEHIDGASDLYDDGVRRALIDKLAAELLAWDKQTVRS